MTEIHYANIVNNVNRCNFVKIKLFLHCGDSDTILPRTANFMECWFPAKCSGNSW
jgi:hypothetical protein